MDTEAVGLQVAWGPVVSKGSISCARLVLLCHPGDGTYGTDGTYAGAMIGGGLPGAKDTPI